MPTDHGLYLPASTAADVMTRGPISISSEATVHEAVVFLTERRISAAPVITDAGRPIGVVTEADILRYTRDHVEHLTPVERADLDRELTLPSGEHLSAKTFEVEVPDVTRVRDIMSPVVYAVREKTPIFEVVRQLVRRRIHRLFVVDDSDSLVGVITTLDLLSRLRFPNGAANNG